MTPLMLQDALCDFLKEVVGSYLLSTNKSITKAPQIVPSYLPLKGSTDTADFPFVIVRVMSQEDTQGESKLVVKLIVGVYAEDIVQGPGDLMNVIERIRQALFKSFAREIRHGRSFLGVCTYSGLSACRLRRSNEW